ncbi:MAG: hypothetical protein LBS27_11900 [Bifidobacteriaceae bacterium]|nr:hypothetical protein [Bifidobacteriaceae bacterium]
MGNLVLRDTFLLPTESAVPAEIREYLRGQVGGYFASEYLAGLSVLTSLAGLLLLARSWRLRIASVIVGFGLIGGAFAAHNASLKEWKAHEREVNAERIYPFDQFASTCGMSGHDWGIRFYRSEEFIDLGGYSYYTWMAHSPSPQPGDIAQGGSCDQIVVFRDLRVVRTINLAKGIGSVGSLCNTDGTPDGILWFYEGWGREWGYESVAQTGTYTIRINDPTSTEFDFIPNNGDDGFYNAYPMCYD